MNTSEYIFMMKNKCITLNIKDLRNFQNFICPEYIFLKPRFTLAISTTWVTIKIKLFLNPCFSFQNFLFKLISRLFLLLQCYYCLFIVKPNIEISEPKYRNIG